MAAVIVLEAIFEADLPEEQYAYRPREAPMTPSRRHTGCSIGVLAKWSMPT